MLKKYLEITLLPDDQMDPRYLWEQLYKQIHLALSSFSHKNGKCCIGVSFPQYNPKTYSLGYKVRMFAPGEAELIELNISQYLADLTDYVHQTTIKNTPLSCEHVCFSSVKRRTASSASKLARRRVKRANERGEKLVLETVISEYNDINKNLDLPFINMISNSTGNKFPLTIAKTRVSKTKGGDLHFSNYGLSSQTCVPEF